MAENKQEPQKSGSTGTESREHGGRQDSHASARVPSVDILSRNRLYPDAQALFTFASKPFESARDICVVVLDTNQLLLPYTVSQNALSDIRKVYERLIEGKRLVVPGQVAREFVDHRFTKIGDAISTLNQFRSSLGNHVKVLRREHDYPFLKGLPEYLELARLIRVAEANARECAEAYSEVNDQVGRLIEVIQGWYANDPVSDLYRRLFSIPGVVVDPVLDDAQIREEFRYRKANRVLPGFNDEGIGDLLIWKTILEVAQSSKKPVIFVSGDEKNDWLKKTGDIVIAPRYELVDEFRRASGGETFYFVSLAALLGLFGASLESIQEVQESDQASARERAARSSTTTATTTTAGPSYSGSALIPGSPGIQGPHAAFHGPSFSGASTSVGSPSGHMSWDHTRSGSGSGYVSGSTPSGDTQDLHLYWEDGETSPMTYDRGVWKGPSHRLTASGERVPVPFVQVTDDAVIVDGTRYAKEINGAIVADVVHEGHRI